MAGVGITLEAQTVRQARPDDPQIPRRQDALAAVRLGLSNARLEGLNSKVRLISRRRYGFHGPEPLISLIYLCAGGGTITLPFTPNS